MSKLCQIVLQIAKKTKTNIQINNSHGTKPDAETSPNSSDSSPNPILGPESEVLLIC